MAHLAYTCIYGYTFKIAEKTADGKTDQSPYPSVDANKTAAATE